MNSIPIFSSLDSPRLRYVIAQVEASFWDVTFNLYTKKPNLSSEEIGINFSHENLPNWFSIPPRGMLFEKSLDAKWKNSYLELDPFSFLFFALSRYEEYLPFSADPHGRFPAKESVFYPRQKIPLVDKKLEELRLQLTTFGFEIPAKKASLPVRFSFDIDQIFRDKSLGSKRFLLSTLNLIRKGEFAHVQNRILTQVANRNDAYDCFAYLQALFAEKSEPLLFWHCGELAPYDAPNQWSLATENILKNSMLWSEAGIHPSYAASVQSNQLNKEIQEFVRITGTSPQKSRQHYILLNFPKTYRKLLLYGIKQDYSMGYADDIGFRAGTCKSFFWYDLEKEKTTDLEIFPFCAMDVSLKRYLQKSDADSEALLHELLATCKEYGGTFIPIFHNQNLIQKAPWSHWRTILENLIQTAYAS